MLISEKQSVACENVKVWSLSDKQLMTDAGTDEMKPAVDEPVEPSAN